MVVGTRIIEELRRNPKNVRFEHLCNLVQRFGFRFRGGKGSHRIFVREGVEELLNLQNAGGKAKPYQVRQFIKLVDKYNLQEEEPDE